MDTKRIQKVLTYAAGVLGAAGVARTKVGAVTEVADLLGDAPDATIEEFVARTKGELDKPEFRALPAQEIAKQLRAAEPDQSKFDGLLAEMRQKRFPKDKALEVAALYVGVPLSARTSKPKALDAIGNRFKDRKFQDSKARLNEKVTPW